MLANNETGVITDLRPVVAAAHAAGALVHTDATQYVGRLAFSLAQDLRVDLLSLSAHKFGGPQGVGALFVRRSLPLPLLPQLVGSGQERLRRAGMLNVAGIAGLGAAADAFHLRAAQEPARIAALRDTLEAGLTARVPGCRVNGAGAPRLPGVTSATFPGLPAVAVLAAMPHVAACAGSACFPRSPESSHVLRAMGRSRDEADATIRFSLGHATTPYDVERALAAVTTAVAQVRWSAVSSTETTAPGR